MDSNEKYYKDHNEVFKNIVSEITVAQITISDVQLLMNSIKAKLT